MAAITQTISINLSVLTDNDLLNYATVLISKLPTVPAYSGLVPAVADGRELTQDFGTAVANATTGGQAQRVERNGLRPQLEAILRQWSAYATEHTPGNVVLWAQAGFRLTKGETTPRTPLAAPTRFTLTDGPAKGSVELRQNAQAGTKAYGYEYALVPAEGQPAQWHYCLGNTGTCVVAGLLSGRQYQFRCYAWNGTGETAYSVIETRYVQ